MLDKDVEVSVHYAILLSGPFKIPRKMKRASVILYLRCPEIDTLKKSLTIHLRHWIQDRRRAPMYFMKAPNRNSIPFQFELFEDHCSQAIGDNCGSLEIHAENNLLCIATESDNPTVKCYGVLLKNRSRPPASENQSKEHFRLCLLYAVPSMFQVCLCCPIQMIIHIVDRIWISLLTIGSKRILQADSHSRWGLHHAWRS